MFCAGSAAHNFRRDHHTCIHTYFIYLYTVKSSVKKKLIKTTLFYKISRPCASHGAMRKDDDYVLQDCRVGARLTIAVKFVKFLFKIPKRV